MLVYVASAASLTVSSPQSFCGEVSDGSGNPYETITIDASVNVCGSQGYANFTAENWINITSSGSINADGAGGAGGTGGYSDDYYGGGDSGDAGTGTGGAGGGYQYDPVDNHWYGYEGKSGGINTNTDSKSYSIGGGGGGGGAAQSEERGPADAGDGGSGAGAIVLQAEDKIEVYGNVYARGQNGGSGSVGEYSAQSAGGGAGGAGGTILIDAKEVEVGGNLNADGGSGGRGDCTGSNYERAVGGEGGNGGQIKVFYSLEFLNSSMSYSTNGGSNGVTECTFDGDKDRWTQDGSNGVYNTVRENIAPDEPSISMPADGSTNLENSVMLEVSVSDPNGEALDVSFYNAEDGAIIGSLQGVEDGSNASVTWNGLEWGEQYSWYAESSDGSAITKSPTWSFETANPPSLDSFSLNKNSENIVYGTNVKMEADVSDPAGEGVSEVNFSASKGGDTVFSRQNGTLSDKWESATVTADTVGEEIEITIGGARSSIGAVSDFNESINFTISPPVPESQFPTEVGARTAILNGELLEYGDFNSGDIDLFFRWKEASKDTWSQTSSENLDSPETVSEKINGLKADTTYEYKAVATWNTEEESSTQSFTTDSPSLNVSLKSPVDNTSVETTGPLEFNYSVESNVNGTSKLYVNGSLISSRSFEGGEEMFSVTHPIKSAGQTEWYVELEAENYTKQKTSEKRVFRIPPTSFENVSVTINSDLPELFVGREKEYVPEGSKEKFSSSDYDFIASQSSEKLKAVIPTGNFYTFKFRNVTSGNDILSVGKQGKNDRFLLAANTGSVSDISERIWMVKEDRFLSVSMPSFTRSLPEEHTVSVIKNYADINITGEFILEPGVSSELTIEASREGLEVETRG